jgi:hypothetical protein
MIDSYFSYIGIHLNLTQISLQSHNLLSLGHEGNGREAYKQFVLCLSGVSAHSVHSYLPVLDALQLVSDLLPGPIEEEEWSPGGKSDASYQVDVNHIWASGEEEGSVDIKGYFHWAELAGPLPPHFTNLGSRVEYVKRLL